MIFTKTALLFGPLVGGFLSGYSTRGQVRTWYKSLEKPSWTPPSYLFPIAWTALYTAMGIASWLVFPLAHSSFALKIYFTQLALNFAWSPLFFNLHLLLPSAIEIGILNGFVGWTLIEFWKLKPLAGALLIPYLGWVSYANALTWSIWYLNRQKNQKEDSTKNESILDPNSTNSNHEFHEKKKE